MLTRVADAYFGTLQRISIGQKVVILSDFPAIGKHFGYTISPGEIEGKVIVLFLPLVLINLVLSVVSSIFAILAALSLLAAVVLLLIPKLLHAMLRVAFFSDLFSFSIYFLTLANYKNLYQCFEAATARTETAFFKRALVRLQLGELKSVQEAMRYLIEETRDFGYEAYEILSIIEEEIGKASPNYEAALSEVLLIQQGLVGVTTERFRSALNMALGVLGILPAVVLTLVPFFLMMANFDPTLSFVMAAVLLLIFNILAMLLLATSLPVGGSFVNVKNVDWMAVKELFGIKKASLPNRMEFLYLSLALLLMGVISPVFIVFSGVVLALYAVPAMDYEALLGRITRELPSVPVFARKVSYRLKRDMALEKALEDPTTISRAVRVKACTRTFLIEEASVLERVIYDMGEMGKKLGESLAALAKYLNESIKQKLLTAQLFRNFRLTIYLLLFFIPLIPIVSIYILKMISGYTGFEPSGSDILGGSIFFELMDRMKEVNTKAAAVSTLMVSYVTNACLAVLASFASGIYYSEKYRFYLLLAGVAFSLAGFLLVLLV